MPQLPRKNPVLLLTAQIALTFPKQRITEFINMSAEAKQGGAKFGKRGQLVAAHLRLPPNCNAN